MGKGEDIPYLHLNKKKQHCGRDISWIRGIYSSVTICSKNCHLIFALGKGEEIPYLIQNKNKHGHVVPQKIMKGRGRGDTGRPSLVDIKVKGDRKRV